MKDGLRSTHPGTARCTDSDIEKREIKCRSWILRILFRGASREEHSRSFAEGVVKNRIPALASQYFNSSVPAKIGFKFPSVFGRTPVRVVRLREAFSAVRLLWHGIKHGNIQT
jgi:hypothetical protein